jgi:uncharacterized integral membrane protein
VKVLSWLVGVPVAAAILLFALSNRQDITLALWPLEDVLVVQAYVAILGTLLVGVVLGGLLSGAASLKHRRAVRRQTRRADDLDRQLQGLKAEGAADRASPPDAKTP